MHIVMWNMLCVLGLNYCGFCKRINILNHQKCNLVLCFVTTRVKWFKHCFVLGCVCEIRGRRMVYHISCTSEIERWENICVNKNIDFHSYVINIHSFKPKPTYDLETLFSFFIFFSPFFFCFMFFFCISLPFSFYW